MHKIFGLLPLLLLMMACQSNSAQNASFAHTLEVKEYLDSMKAMKNHQLIDVRTADEFKEGHLSHATNIDYNGKDFEKLIGALDKSKPTFLYCMSGGRSSSAMEYMVKNGFTAVYNMKGGLLKWKAAKLEMATNNTEASTWTGLSRAAYDTLCNSKVPVLIDFQAKWCLPCKQLAPILAEIQKEYNGKIKIIPMDIDENKSLANELHISSIPFLMYYKKGKLLMNIDGLTDKENLVKSLELRK